LIYSVGGAEVGAKNEALFSGRVPLDKVEGFVKGRDVLSGE